MTRWLNSVWPDDWPDVIDQTILEFCFRLSVRVVVDSFSGWEPSRMSKVMFCLGRRTNYDLQLLPFERGIWASFLQKALCILDSDFVFDQRTEYCCTQLVLNTKSEVQITVRFSIFLLRTSSPFNTFSL